MTLQRLSLALAACALLAGPLDDLIVDILLDSLIDMSDALGGIFENLSVLRID